MLQYIRLIGIMSNMPQITNDELAHFEVTVTDPFSQHHYTIMVEGKAAMRQLITLPHGFVAVEGRLAWVERAGGDPTLLVRAQAFQGLSNQAYQLIMTKIDAEQQAQC